jgi:cobalt/nickel transport system permease protein
VSCDHRVDARLRLALAVIASVAIALTTHPGALAWLLGAAAVGALLAAALSELGWRDLARRLLAVNGFMLLVWATLPWSWSGGGLLWSAEGAALATRISVRTNAVALAVSALLAGLDAFALARAAAGLGLPPKLARLLLLTVRYIELIADTRRRIDRAMRARGFVARADCRSLRVIAHMMALLLAHAITRAERVELALRARGFSSLAAGLRPHHHGEVPRSHWAWAAGTAGALAISWLLVAA